MTNREFFNAIINANVNDELTAHATAELAKLDKRNAQRSSKPSKTSWKTSLSRRTCWRFWPSSL